MFSFLPGTNMTQSQGRSEGKQSSLAFCRLGNLGSMGTPGHGGYSQGTVSAGPLSQLDTTVKAKFWPKTYEWK